MMRSVWVLRIKLEAAVHAGHDEVEALQHVVWIIQRAVSQNIRLDAFENPKVIPIRLVQPVDGPVLLHDFLDRQAARVMRGFRMVGDAEILIAPLPGRLRHDFKRIHPIRQVGMRMQDAAQIAIGYERRQLPLDRALDLAAAFAQLGRNEWQTKRCVDVFFASRGDHLAPAPQSLSDQAQALAVASARSPRYAVANRSRAAE